MKPIDQLKGSLMVLAGIAIASPVYSSEPDRILLKSGEPRCVSYGEGEICGHFFEGTSIVFPEKLEVPKSCAGLRASLEQITSRLTMPLGQEMTLNEKSCDGYTQIHKFPKVKRETVLEATIYYEDLSGNWKPLWKSPPMKIYPKDILSPLRNWASANRLVLKDKDGATSDFFESQKIEFEERVFPVVGLEEGGSVVIVIGDKSPDEISRFSRGNNVIHFKEKYSTLPKVVERRVNGKAFIEVEMKLLDRLATDPVAQKAFLEIFKMSL